MATRVDLRARLIEKLGLLAIDEMIPTSSLNQSINNGLERMATEFAWPWLVDFTTISVIAGTTLYNLPARTTKVIAIGSQASEDSLQAVSPDDMMRWIFQEGEPTIYLVRGSQIQVAPTPIRNDTLTLAYVKAENLLDDDSDVVLTPDWFLDVIVTYAAIDQAVRLKDVQLISSLEMVRKQWITSLADDSIRTSKPSRIMTRVDI